MDPFEQSADMRLLELQRRALGKEAPPPPNWSASQTDMNEAIPLHEEAAPVLEGARLTVDLAATPNAKLIPGAVVTLSLSVHNNGERAADRVRVSAPVPGNASYRSGSLQIDQRPLSDADADSFFGEGYTLPKLAGGQRAGFLWKVSVEPGTKPLVISPHVSAANAGIAGGAPILLSRAVPAKLSRLPQAYQPEEAEQDRPFYELDEQEARSFERELITGTEKPVGHDAPLFVMPDLPEAPQELQASPIAQSERVIDTGAALETAASVEAVPLPEAVPAQATIPARLYSTFDGASLAIVKKLFATESYGQIPHYILQNSLACGVAGTGRDVGIRAHLSGQAGLLSRALLLHKLNKPMHVGDFATGKTGFDLNAANERSADAPPSRLYMPLTQADVDFCAPVESRNPLETFVRVRQIAVALQARQVATADDALSERCSKLLEAYATSARAAINRTFIRAKLDKNFDPFGAADPAADKIAHELIEALESVLQG